MKTKTITLYSFYGTIPGHKRPQIVMHFIQKLQGGNNNETY